MRSSAQAAWARSIARDTRLGRDVAIKVLPDLFANDPERLARFTREAQTLATSDAAAALANSPTITSPALTERGVILGTAAYMSPEQAAGKAVDKRSDLWAFGVVFLEMLTGRRVFAGADVAHVLAEVLKSEPDWTTLPATTPATIRRLLRRCLEKDRKRRLDSAAAARLEIEEAMIAPLADDGDAAQPGPAPRSAWSRALPWAVTGLFGVALVAALLVRSPWRSRSALTRITLSLSRDNSLTIEGGTQPFWSHTGRELFYQTVTAMFAVPILDAHDLRAGTPQRLFVKTRAGGGRYISADDQRFLMIEKAEANQSSQLNLVQNWFEELKRLVPTGKK